MDYKLAKQLKDAGFPQEISWGDFLYDDELGGKILYTVRKDKNEAINGLTKIPRLSELIEACGDGFVALRRIKTSRQILWEAEGILKGKTPDFDLGQMNTEQEPKIAVAKLWLRLYGRRKV